MTYNVFGGTLNLTQSINQSTSPKNIYNRQMDNNFYATENVKYSANTTA